MTGDNERRLTALERRLGRGNGRAGVGHAIVLLHDLRAEFGPDIGGEIERLVASGAPWERVKARLLEARPGLFRRLALDMDGRVRMHAVGVGPDVLPLVSDWEGDAEAVRVLEALLADGGDVEVRPRSGAKTFWTRVDPVR